MICRYNNPNYIIELYGALVVVIKREFTTDLSAGVEWRGSFVDMKVNPKLKENQISDE